MATSELRRRTLFVDARAVFEALAVAFVAMSCIVIVAVCFRTPWLGLLMLVAVPALVTVSLYRRWRELRRNWKALQSWAERPLRREGKLVIQQDAAGNETGRIDTSDHYTVNWERFDDERTLYLISQRDQVVTVSTLAPDAEELILGAFRIRNYPCVEWPYLDI